MSPSCHTARSGLLASRRMMAESAGRGLPLRDSAGRGVGRRIRSWGAGGFRRWSLAGGQQQAAQEEGGEKRAGCRRSITSGSRRAGAGVVSVGSLWGATPGAIGEGRQR